MYFEENIDCLGSTLSQCALKHNKLESMFRKKQVPQIHAYIPQHTSHTHHDHTPYSHMYDRVYKCTHCDCKGHLPRFCFDRLNSKNFVNKNSWAPYDANPLGLRKEYGILDLKPKFFEPVHQYVRTTSKLFGQHKW